MTGIKWQERGLLFLVVGLAFFVSFVSAHKGSSQLLEETANYNVQFVLMPGILVEEQEQQMYLEAIHANGKAATGLRAVFTIFHDHPLTLERSDVEYLTSLGLLDGSYTVAEGEDGMYSVSHTFAKKGPYLIVADLYDGKEKVISIQRHVHVEPNGPSTLFWLYMLLAVITGLYIATKSYKV